MEDVLLRGRSRVPRLPLLGELRVPRVLPLLEVRDSVDLAVLHGGPPPKRAEVGGRGVPLLLGRVPLLPGRLEVPRVLLLPGGPWVPLLPGGLGV